MRTTIDSTHAYIHRLNVEHANDRIHFQMGRGDFPEAVIKSPHGSEMTVSFYGGHLLNWRDVDCGELLYLSSHAVFQDGKAIRGGVPIIFPWFGSQEGRPHAHGIARNQMWKFTRCHADLDQTSISIALDCDIDETREKWRIELTYTLSDQKLRTDVLIKNKANEPLSCQIALHTYFNVRDIQEVKIDGLNGIEFVDTTKSERPRLTQDNSSVIFPGRVDSIYIHAPQRTIIQTGFAHDIELTTNLPDRVTWNPGEALAATMSDIGIGEYARFVCVEPGAIENRLQCQAGGTYQGWQELRVLRRGS